MNDLNRCEFIGRLGQDPEGRYLPSGSPVTNLSIAVNSTWKDSSTNEKKERVTWIPIVIFGKLAEIANEYLKSGSQIYVAGEMRIRKWQDRDGNDRYSTEIVASELQMLGSRQGSDTQRSEAPAPSGGFVDSDIPF